MTQPQTPAPAQQPAPRARSAPKQVWHASDLTYYASRWGCSRAAIRAAMRGSGKDSVGSPDEAEALVKAFMAKDLAEEEREGREARAKAKGKK